MTQEQIIEGNILIGKFHDPNWVYNGDKDTICSYHLYWDYLMPVVEKIISSGSGFHLRNFSGPTHKTRVTMNYFQHSYSKNNKEFEVTNDSMIKAVWLVVVKFIEWYNQKKG